MNKRTRVLERGLIVRLSLATLLLAIFLGGVAFMNERRRLGASIEERASLAAELLKAEVRRLARARAGGDAPLPAQEALENLAHTLPPTESGRFVFLTLHDAQRRELARLADPHFAAAPRLEAALMSRGLRFPEKGFEFGPAFGIADTPDVPVALAIEGAQDGDVAYTNGVFVLSQQAEEKFLHAMLVVPLLVAAIVIVTTLLIYPIVRNLTRRLGTLSLQLLDANIDTLQVLGGAIAKRDSDTDAHNYRVTVYSVRLAEAVGLDAKTMRSLIKGAFLHDVGKIGIRDNILLKPGRLDEQEFAEMRLHVSHGLDIVRHAAWLRDAVDVVGCHHERFDGGGYGRGLSGEAIPITARIFAIVDVFDALASERPYKQPVSLEDTLAILRENAGSHFDAALVARFEGLAPTLYAAYAQREEDARREVDAIVDRYFKEDLSSVLQEVEATA